MEYMFREGNHKFRKAVSNLHAIVISFNLFHILNHSYYILNVYK